MSNLFNAELQLCTFIESNEGKNKGSPIQYYRNNQIHNHQLRKSCHNINCIRHEVQTGGNFYYLIPISHMSCYVSKVTTFTTSSCSK